MIDLFLNYYIPVCGLLIYVAILILIYVSDNEISKWLKKYIFSDIPFLQISDDSNFHTVETRKPLLTYRFSLFFIPLGNCKIYFVTYKEKFKWISILSFEEIMQDRFTKTLIKMEQDYNHISTNLLNTPRHKKNSIEILKDNITLYSNIKNITMTKSTIYVALLAAIFTMFSTQNTFFNDLLQIYEVDSIVVKFLFTYWLVIFFNFSIFNIQLISVHNIHRETYDDFVNKLSMDEVKYFYNNNCFDAFYSRKLVSYMRNIELYLKRIFVLGIIFFVVKNLIY